MQGLQFETWKSRVCHQVLAGLLCRANLMFTRTTFFMKIFSYIFAHLTLAFCDLKGDAWKNICLEHNNTYLIKLRVPPALCRINITHVCDSRWLNHFLWSLRITKNDLRSGNKAKGNTRCKFELRCILKKIVITSMKNLQQSSFSFFLKKLQNHRCC